MRLRTDNGVTPVNGAWYQIDYPSGTVGATNPFTSNVVTYESLMWDDATGGKLQTKPCQHVVFDVVQYDPLVSTYHSADLSNAPNPAHEYVGVPWYSTILNRWRPPALQGQFKDYIPVSGATTNDIDDCVFKAYNQYITGVRSLDASQSLAESGETPQLFRIWQRRRGLATNLTSGFLNYSFGWRPVISDFKAILNELRSFPKTVRKRLKAIGDKDVVRHYQFSLGSTVDNAVFNDTGQNAPYEWGKFGTKHNTVTKSRVVTVTIRAKVKPKLTGYSQDLLNKLGALGLIPSFATLWSVTRLSFVVDWFYNIGGAIENLQGSLTHDVSNVRICVTDLRTRSIEARCESINGSLTHLIGRVNQRYFGRGLVARPPVLPVVRVPHRIMPYILLGLIGLGSTKRGNVILRAIDGTPLSKAITRKVLRAIGYLPAVRRKQLERALRSWNPHSGAFPLTPHVGG